MSEPNSPRASNLEAERRREIESAVVGMYTAHPMPSLLDKLGFADRRMHLRLLCCGVSGGDYVGRDVIDAGCGTGEYACWFAAKGARTTGIDLSPSSLKEAAEYAKSAGLRNVKFESRSVLETGFPDASFDFIYCTGVLHHTPDPFSGFQELCRVTRPNGKILVSLYNATAFLPREFRRRVALLLGGNDLDRRVRWGSRIFPLTARKLLRERSLQDPESALYDYFAIPHESLHSMGGTLRWFDHCGIEYMGSFPPARLRDYPVMFACPEYNKVEKKFQGALTKLVGQLAGSGRLPGRRPGFLSRIQVQLLWMAAGFSCFCVCGRKPQ